MKTEIPEEVWEQMKKEGWATLEQQRQYWIDKEAQLKGALCGLIMSEETEAESDNATNETREALIAALKPFALAFKETTPVGSIPDENIWIWKPSDNRRETHGISRAHLKTAACLIAHLSATADPKPEEDLSRTESLSEWYDEREQVYRLRDEGQNPDGDGESYAARNL